jgi:hypothetical protein
MVPYQAQTDSEPGLHFPMPTIYSLAAIMDLAKKFSDVLEQIVSDNNRLQTFGFGPFPGGGCKRSSRLFGFFLEEYSVPTNYVVAERKTDQSPDKQEHAWLQIRASSSDSSPIGVIDLTCRQFPDCQLSCPYVASDSIWHEHEWTIFSSDSVAKLKISNEGMIPEVDLLSDIRTKLLVNATTIARDDVRPHQF